MNLTATTTLTEAVARQWPVVVIGAGPAGSFLARALARAGIEVLLVDRAVFPRWKVCGCCLNGAALTLLDDAGLGQLVPQRGGVALERVHLSAGSGAVELRLPSGAALSREAFDSALIQAAIDEGVSFLPGTMARLLPEPVSDARHVELHGLEESPSLAGIPRSTTARIVIAADGLTGSSLVREPGRRFVVRSDSRIGAGAVASQAAAWFKPGTIYMACGAGGYVGAVRLEDGRLDLAAALDPQHVRRHHGLGNAVASIIAARGWPGVPDVATLSWRGTPPLTRQAASPGGDRYFVVGDAAGYVEPFTGEGMAWALASASALVPLVEEGVRRWKSALIREWGRRLHQLLARRRLLCCCLTWCLRSPLTSSALVQLLRLAPFLARPFLSGLNHPLRTPPSSKLAPAALTP